MDLGLGFEDEDFESKKQPSQENKKSYNAKFCYSFWYDSEVPEPENAGVIFKFRGDNLYQQQNFTEAINCYKEGLDSLPPNNKSLRQDILECMARCYLHIDKHTESLDIAQQLVKDAKSFDQVMQTKLLMSQIQEKMEDVDGLEETLKHLLTMHPFTYSFWLKLGHCYKARMERETDSDNFVKMKRLSCFIRVRLLLRNIIRNSSSFFRTKLLQLVIETEEEQTQLNVSDDLVAVATKFLREDIYQNEDENEETDSNEQKVTLIEAEQDENSFERRWFSWIPDYDLT